MKCHQGPKAKGGFDVDLFSGEEQALAEPELFELLYELVDSGEMPPAGEQRPDAELVRHAAQWLGSLETTRPEAPSLRRLNRREYVATVLDVFGLEVPAGRLLGDDPVGHGFDTAAGVQTWTGERLEGYLRAAEYVACRIFPAARDGLTLGPFLDGQLMARGQPGGYLAHNGTIVANVDLPVVGRWRVRIETWGQQAGPDPVRIRLVAGAHVFETRDLLAVRAEPELIEFEVELDVGRQAIGLRFLNDWYMPRDQVPEGLSNDRNMGVNRIWIEGPLEPPGPSQWQQDLEARHASGEVLVRRAGMLAELASALWRRPVGRAEMEPYAALAEASTEPALALQLGLMGILASPNFSFLLDAGGERSEGHELAARLSYFLWSSVPDQRLMNLASDGSLLHANVLLAEAERMLADPRARRLLEGFVPQWLQLGALAQHRPSKELFPEFDGELRASMLEESLAFVGALVAEDADPFELVRADWTLVNARLARHYGLALALDASGNAPAGFSRVSLAGTPRRGLLGHASVLTVTSRAARTSPVLRGKWVLEALLGSAPPPPPPGVGSLVEGEAQSLLSLRERLALHREEASCAVCHVGMDPLGFGLEGFDPVGAVRVAAEGEVLDDLGELPDGRSFRGAVGLAGILDGDPSLPLHLAEELLVYGVGRALRPEDRQALRASLGDLEAEPLGLRSLILAIIGSPTFTQAAAGPR
ncbi:MAG: hypothetical protein ACI9HE_001586 [Planctomycetota bacterium]|jgi:hypothetical protein